MAKKLSESQVVQSPLLKFSKFQNEFMKWSFLPKYEQKIVCPHYTRQKSWQFFVHILVERNTSWIHSEIYWPLQVTTTKLWSEINWPLTTSGSAIFLILFSIQVATMESNSKWGFGVFYQKSNQDWPWL